MSPRFAPGEAVKVKALYPKRGHIRTPFYARGKTGIVERICGAFENPEALAFGKSGLPKRTLYRVRFDQAHLWSDYAGYASDKVDIEIFEHWLEPVGKGDP